RSGHAAPPGQDRLGLAAVAAPGGPAVAQSPDPPAPLPGGRPPAVSAAPAGGAERVGPASPDSESGGIPGGRPGRSGPRGAGGAGAGVVPRRLGPGDSFRGRMALPPLGPDGSSGAGEGAIGGPRAGRQAEVVRQPPGADLRGDPGAGGSRDGL